MGAPLKCKLSFSELMANLDGRSQPKKLCEFLLERCRETGVTLHRPVKPVGITTDVDGRLSGLRAKRNDGTEEMSTSITPL